ncbi:regulator of protease activity HflC (stomatin/prohibitin superfamily) [Pseudonocardia hierapolitana]|uniref:Regulator of protease activity HflC (Stomatin/prohibitin superfamily) n=1 Tax=Pseudonocardia hierapolitana TaxID=1128676 RepID=A0A561SQ39_9PSEU|nr:slipin family protein [Pseudonocardia hierapolitana]TWF76988.1 regulator of protease activity HflC (stomatin/prohibitin superfamily) [Pseudonocardia hierapolitana]
MLTTALIVIVALVILLVASGVRMVQQYQRGVVLRFGRLLPVVRQPGLQLMIPVADRMVKVPVQTIVLDVPPQGAITKDNVTLSVDAVVYFRVTDPVKAVVNVENYLGAISQVARTSLRSVIGRADLDTMLSDREQVNAELRAVIDTPTDDWGISVDRVEIKDIALPESMRRAMAHQAEAERDRRARVIAADGEYQASTRLADAARVMADTPGALQLRLLQTVSDVASDQNSTLVMPLPVELLRFFENATGAPSRDRAASAPSEASNPLPPVRSVAPAPDLPNTDGDEAGKRAVTTDQEAGPR